jgi:5-(carboxyamino)imidazole ribonucleotide synthase
MTLEKMKSTDSFFGRKIGIIGGGQLAQMLCLEGAKLGLEMHVYSSLSTDPAAQVVRHWHRGELIDVVALSDFFKSVEYVTIESEFIDTKVLLEVEAISGRSVAPSHRLIDELSDRFKQKTWLEKMGLKTSPFKAISHAADVEAFFKANERAGIVLKKRRFGYDGYGTYILRTQKDLSAWLEKHSLTASDFIAEKFIKFRRELAVQFAVNADGDVLRFPLVEWQAREAKCHWVRGPVNTKTVSGADPLLARIEKALRKDHYVGAVAFELFDTGRELFVNEVAPRVHNSGHYTLEALPLNQFSAHLLAILNKPLPPRQELSTKGFAMLNLVGQSSEAPRLPNVNTAFLHWYGKIENRRGRKMGHLTALASSPQLALKELQKIEKKIKL